MNVVIAGGGTAGHVFPAIALARTLADEHGARVSFLGTPAGVEARLVSEAGFPFTAVDARPLRRELSTDSLRAVPTTLRSVSRCAPMVAAADAVVGMGGYVSVPAVLAARRAGRAVVLHEQNAVPGLANRLLSRWARMTCLSFGEARRMLPRRARTVVTGNPVRAAIRAVPGARGELAESAIDELGLERGRRTILVFGGSQGALNLDRATVGALRLLRDRVDLQLIVLTGPAHVDRVAGHAEGASPLLVRVLPFLDRMELVYAAADLVVSRAGATSIAEITLCGLPSVLVPYPHATGRHQEANALAVESAGGAMVVADSELTGSTLVSRIRAVLDDQGRRQRMARAAAAWARPDAHRALAAEVVKVAKVAKVLGSGQGDG